MTLHISQYGLLAVTALHSLTLRKYDKKTVREGDILTLACEAKGSDNLKFEWFKDGAAINVSRTQRNMYIMKIPKADPESRTTVLDIDKAHSLDAGVYRLPMVPHDIYHLWTFINQFKLNFPSL